MGFIPVSAFLEEDLATKNLCMCKVMTLYLVTGKHNTSFFCPCFGNPEIIIPRLPLLRHILKFWDKSWWMAVAVVKMLKCGSFLQCQRAAGLGQWDQPLGVLQGAVTVP